MQKNILFLILGFTSVQADSAAMKVDLEEEIYLYRKNNGHKEIDLSRVGYAIRECDNLPGLREYLRDVNFSLPSINNVGDVLNYAEEFYYIKHDLETIAQHSKELSTKIKKQIRYIERDLHEIKKLSEALDRKIENSQCENCIQLKEWFVNAERVALRKLLHTKEALEGK